MHFNSNMKSQEQWRCIYFSENDTWVGRGHYYHACATHRRYSPRMLPTDGIAISPGNLTSTSFTWIACTNLPHTKYSWWEHCLDNKDYLIGEKKIQNQTIFYLFYFDVSLLNLYMTCSGVQNMIDIGWNLKASLPINCNYC